MMPSICHRFNSAKRFPSPGSPTLALLNEETVPSSVATGERVADEGATFDNLLAFHYNLMNIFYND